VHIEGDKDEGDVKFGEMKGSRSRGQRMGVLGVNAETVAEAVDCRYNKKSYCILPVEKLVKPTIQLFDLKNERLQYIYNREFEELKKSFAEL